MPSLCTHPHCYYHSESITRKLIKKARVGLNFNPNSVYGECTREQSYYESIESRVFYWLSLRRSRIPVGRDYNADGAFYDVQELPSHDE